MKGKLIVFEGTDGSGKSTQFKMLCDCLEREGKQFTKLTFPRYSEDSSMLIRMYLNGEFGDSPDSVNAYAASVFYAVDRYASYKQEWSGIYASGGLLLADRYTTSNAVHQASKLEGADREVYQKWLFDFEYRLLELPEPNLVIFLNMPIEIAKTLIAERNGMPEDIHEKDVDYLNRCRESALEAARENGWYVVDCAPNGKLRSVEDIHKEIMAIVYKEVM